MNNSVTTLPADKTDVPGLYSSVQRMLDALNKLVNGEAPATQLSRLEQAKEETSSVDQTATKIEALQALTEFQNMVSLDFNSSDWGGANGYYKGRAVGASFNNTPAGLVADETYFVVVHVVSIGAYTQMVHISGPGTNRVWHRSGQDFAGALANGWSA